MLLADLNVRLLEIQCIVFDFNWMEVRRRQKNNKKKQQSTSDSSTKETWSWDFSSSFQSYFFFFTPNFNCLILKRKSRKFSFLLYGSGMSMSSMNSLVAHTAARLFSVAVVARYLSCPTSLLLACWCSSQCRVMIVRQTNEKRFHDFMSVAIDENEVKEEWSSRGEEK